MFYKCLEHTAYVFYFGISHIYKSLIYSLFKYMCGTQEYMSVFVYLYMYISMFGTEAYNT